MNFKKSCKEKNQCDWNPNSSLTCKTTLNLTNKKTRHKPKKYALVKT
jgi:hypothetical protein